MDNPNTTAALVLYSPPISENRYKIERISPIKPDEYVHTVIEAELTCGKYPANDFLYAFLLGLAVFGFAAHTVVGELIPMILLFI